MLLIVAAAMVTVLAPQEYQHQATDEGSLPDFTEGGAAPFEDQVILVDDPNPKEPDPLYTIRPGTPGTGRDAGGGRATYTLTGSARFTVNIPLMGSRTAILGPGTSYTGRDRNANRIPDDLEDRRIDLGPL
jgi:hypothetical protein